MRIFHGLLAMLTVAVLPVLLHADGLIVVPRPPGPGPDPTPFPLEVKYHRVAVKITGQVATTNVDQEFFNPTTARLEGYYLFPVPPGAVIKNFAMEIDGKMVSAELLDAAKARGIYEDIVRRQRDPALLEYTDRSVFRVRIFPLEPRAGKRVKISYTQTLTADNGLVGYTYPLNTERFSAAPVGDVSLTVRLSADGPLKTIFSPSHPVEIIRHGDREATVGYEAKQVKPDSDFLLYFDTEGGKYGMNVLSHRPSSGDGFFFLTVTPESRTDPKSVLPKDLVFVLDTSGSMAGKKLDQVKKALLFCIGNLNPSDRFELVRFSTEAEGLFGGLKQAGRENMRQAEKFVEDLRAAGGTNIGEALTLAMDAHRSGGDRPGYVVFLTDGKPTIGTTDEKSLVGMVTGRDGRTVRVFTFGVGADLNIHLLDRIAETSKGVRAYVGGEEDLELKLSSFSDKIRFPALTDVRLAFGSGVRVMQTHPRTLPDLFAGSRLVVFGRYSGGGEVPVTLTGMTGGKEVVFIRKLRFPEREERNDFIAPLWAAQRVGYLLDEIRLRGESKELRDEATDLARTYGIVTPYTSYLIVEDEKGRVVRNELPAERQTLGGVAAEPAAGASFKNEYDALRKKDGFAGVTASREVENLKNADNAGELKQGDERLSYVSDGERKNLANQVRTVQGRAFYQNGAVWVDSQAQAVGNRKIVRVQFGSPEYFDLINKESGNAQILALGRNIQFVARGTLYEVYE